MTRTIVDCTDDTTRALVQALADRRKPRAQPTTLAARRHDLTGRRFGRLVVVREVERPATARDSNRRYLCHCDCGGEKVVMSQNLRSGNTQSCGCLWRERQRAAPRFRGTRKETRKLAQEAARLRAQGYRHKDIARRLHYATKSIPQLLRRAEPQESQP